MKHLPDALKLLRRSKFLIWCQLSTVCEILQDTGLSCHVKTWPYGLSRLKLGQGGRWFNLYWGPKARGPICIWFDYQFCSEKYGSHRDGGETWRCHHVETFSALQALYAPYTKASDAELWCFLWSVPKLDWNWGRGTKNHSLLRPEGPRTDLYLIRLPVLFREIWLPPWWWGNMTMSSNENIFRVTGPLCRKFTSHRWIPPHKGQRRRALVFSLICPWTNGWVINRDAGDLRRHHAHYHVIVMNYIVVMDWLPRKTKGCLYEYLCFLSKLYCVKLNNVSYEKFGNCTFATRGRSCSTKPVSRGYNMF